jgi:uncharacterized membrane protein YhaH (DUF805 family)
MNKITTVFSTHVLGLFAFTGRTTPSAFMKNLLVILLAAFVSLFLGFLPVLQFLLILAVLVVLTSTVLSRIEDTGHSKWISLVMLLPVLGWIAGAVIVSLPTGTSGSSTMGKKRPQPLLAAVSVLTISLALVAPLAAIVIAKAPTVEGTSKISEAKTGTGIALASPTAHSSPAPSGSRSPRSNSDSFSSLIAALVVADEATTGYDRALFVHWVDADSDGCDTRKEVLIQESLTNVTLGSGCSLEGGSWNSAYDSLTTADSSSFDIDHFVPLKEAWDSGANLWTASTREAFANDLGYDGSLIAVSASSNRSKSDRDPSDWMPALSSFACQYIYTWVQVKLRWGLAVDGREKATLEQGSIGCDVDALNLSDLAPKAIVEIEPNHADISTEFSEAGQSAPAVAPRASDPQFKTCREAIANGSGDYIFGINPEYEWYQDRDHDGIVCER